MATHIEWTDETWNPMIGCDRVSPGCQGCYAITTARIRESNPNPKVAAAFAGTVHRTEDRVDWTGQVNLLHDRLTQPLRWKTRRKIFVNSMSDLFHQAVPDHFIAQVFAVMALTPHHTYQILTKRHARMRSLLTSSAFRLACENAQDTLMGDPATPGIPRHKRDAYRKKWWSDFAQPLKNVWMGVSVENQEWADIRIPALLDTPAAVRWISAEPLLGPIDLFGKVVRGHRPTLTYWLDGRPIPGETRTTDTGLQMTGFATGPKLDWVVCGGESGPGAHPMHPQWARKLLTQCHHSNVPFLFKQWGQWGPMAPLVDGKFAFGGGMTMADDGTLYQPDDLNYPDGARYAEAMRADHGRAHLTAMYSLGKKAAGRELDGQIYDGYPRAVTS